MSRFSPAGYSGVGPRAWILRGSFSLSRTSACLLLLAGSCLPLQAWADAIVRTQAMSANNIAEIFIEKEFVRVELEIGLQELRLFANLMPDELNQRLTGEAEPLQRRLQIFFEQELAILASSEGTEQLLSGHVVEIGPRERVRRDDVTGEAVAVEGVEAETVIFAQLFYPFETAPDAVTFVNNLGASIGFVVYHQGVAVNDFRYLSVQQTLNLDWADPWYSAFEERSLQRTFFAPMSVFIYVEPYEVRKEIIVRPKDLQQWVDLGLEGLDSIPVDLQPELKARAAEFLANRNPTSIDGELVAGELARVNFLERTLKTSNVIEPPMELDLNVATLGVIFVYPTVEPLPENVQVAWDMFTEKMQIVPGATVDQEGPLPIYLEPDFSVLEWQNFLRFPQLPRLKTLAPPPGFAAELLASFRWLVVALMAAGVCWSGVRFWRAGLRGGLPVLLGVLVIGGGALFAGRQAMLSPAGATELVSGLLHNVYRAFDFRAEGDIYDVLDKSVAGDLLTKVYLETRRGLVLESQGGARAKVKDIELTELETWPSEAGGFIASATWMVSGSVGHWGHLHERKNVYQAELTIRPVDGSWKLIDMEVLSEERL